MFLKKNIRKSKKIKLFLNRFLIIKFSRKKKRLKKKLKRIRKKKKNFLSIPNNYFKRKFDIKITSNNIFCTYALVKNNEIIKTASTGVYKVKTTRKSFKYVYKKFINKFLIRVKLRCKTKFISTRTDCNNWYKKMSKSPQFLISNLKKNRIYFERLRQLKFKYPIILNISVRKKHRRKIIKLLRKRRVLRKKKTPTLLIIQPKKCFNGCRASKKRRKKRLRFRIYKR